MNSRGTTVEDLRILEVSGLGILLTVIGTDSENQVKPRIPVKNDGRDGDFGRPSGSWQISPAGRPRKIAV